MTDHLTQEQLLAYLDGELPRAGMRKAGKHLQACWSCRIEIERLTDDIGIILQVQDEVLAPRLPSPPKQWPGLETRLNDVLEREPGSWEAIRNCFRGVTRPVYAATTAAALLLASTPFWFTPSALSAKEILAKVSKAESKRMPASRDRFVRQRMRIVKTDHGSPQGRSGEMESWRSPAQAYWHVPRGDAAAEDLQIRYEAAGIRTGLPLVAESCEQWTRRTGGITQVEQRPSLIRVSSGVAGSSEVRVAVEVNPESWHIMRLSLDFSDARFDITEAEWTEVARNEVPGEVLAHLEPENAVASASSPAVAPRNPRGAVNTATAHLDEVEIEVRFILHRLGADLGEPVEVVRDGADRVIVNAWGLSSERQAALAAALSRPDVALRLQPPTRIGHEKARSTVLAIQPSWPAASAVQHDRLRGFFGTEERQEQVTRSLLSASTEVLSHLYALKELAGHISPASERALSGAAKTMLQDLISDHVRGARKASVDFSLTMQPLFKEFGANTDLSDTVSPQSDWRIVASRALDSFRLADRLLRSMLTTSEQPVVPEEALPQIHRRLADLDTCLKLLAN